MTNTKTTTTMKNSSTYQVKAFNNNTLFAVVDDYNMYGNYYKSEKAANKYLQKVCYQAGEINS